MSQDKWGWRTVEQEMVTGRGACGKVLRPATSRQLLLDPSWYQGSATNYTLRGIAV